MSIKIPFGEALNPELLGAVNTFSFATASGRKEVDVDAAVFFITSPTAVKSRELVLDIDDNLPVGSIIHIEHLASASGSKLVLGTGFDGVNRMAKTTAVDGTGNWYQTFIYNGTAFIPTSAQFLKV